MRIWKTKIDTKSFVRDLVVTGELCPCDKFQSVRVVAMKNTLGGWDDIHPMLIHLSDLDEIK